MSVVVPVYNPGHRIDGLLESLIYQSLARDEFEAVFVDDGSTDGTPDRIDRLAVDVPNFRVIRAPRSGWPGRPRNLGIDAARGEYIQFADHDDQLGQEALDRLYRFATKNRSDIVVGREIREGRRFPYGLRLFAESHSRIALDDPRLLDPLSPHKLFRRLFLLDNGVRFPEAPRIFEDYAFVMEAYLLAGVISVLSDYPCYVWRRREGERSAGEKTRGRTYADTIDVIHRRTQPGPLRESLLAHWYERRVLSFANSHWAADSTERTERRFRTWQEDAARFFPIEVDARLPGIMRIRSTLVRSGDVEHLRALGRSARMRLGQGAASLRTRRRQTVLEAEAWLCSADGAPLETEAIDGRRRWRLPVDLAGAVPSKLLDLTPELDRMQPELIARRRGTGDALPLPAASCTLLDDGRVGARVSVRIGRKARGGFARAPYPGTWDLFIGLSVAGWYVRAPLRPGWSHDVALPRQSIRLWTTKRGTAALSVSRQRPLHRYVALLPQRVRRLAGRARHRLPRLRPTGARARRSHRSRA